MRGIIHPAVQYPAEPLKTETAQTAWPIPASLSAEPSAHVAARPGEKMPDRHVGSPVRAVDARVCSAVGSRESTGLPEAFRYHDLRHTSAKTTLDTYGHLWPDSDDSTRAAIEAVMTARADSLRTTETA